MGVDLGIEPVWQYIARASTARQKGDFQEAEFYARKAIFTDPSIAATYVLLCEILEKLGKNRCNASEFSKAPVEARASCSTAIRIPSDTTT
jgi:Tfp pilus assembly protein PilF